MVLEEFKKRYWSLTYGEYAVASMAHRLGTGVDLIVYDWSANVHRAIELKCGMHAYFELAEGKMNGVLRDIPNSRYTQACMQLAVTHHLLRLTSPLYAMGTPQVVHVSDCGVKIYELPPWAKTATLTILNNKKCA
jgi:hypothetical protein